MNAQTATTIKNAADTILGSVANAEVFNGTVYLKGVTARQVAKIETALIELLKCGIIVTPYAKTPRAYALDFV